MEKRTKEAYLVDKAEYKEAFLEYVLKAYLFGDYGRDMTGYYSNNCRIDPFDMVIAEDRYLGYRILFGLNEPTDEHIEEYGKEHFLLIQRMRTGDIYVYSAQFTNDNYWGEPFNEKIQDAVFYCRDEELEGDPESNSYIQKLEKLNLDDKSDKLKALGEMVINEIQEYIKTTPSKDIDSLQRLSIDETEEVIWVEDEEEEEDRGGDEDVKHWAYAFYELNPNEYEIYVSID